MYYLIHYLLSANLKVSVPEALPTSTLYLKNLTPWTGKAADLQEKLAGYCGLAAPVAGTKQAKDH